jgi:uncharacterized protein YuzE
MKLTYDRNKNIAYLRLRPPGAEVDTIRISDEMNIDIAPDGYSGSFNGAIIGPVL